MKKLILLLLFIPLVFSCDKEGVNDPLIYSIEGKWVWSPSENRADANTMYEFVDGVRYTYYCNTCPADDVYWNSLDKSDRLPRTNPYTFENNTLTVDLHHGNELVKLVTFECGGGKLLMDGQFSHLWRLSSDCD